MVFCFGLATAFSQTKDSTAISLTEVEITGVQSKQFTAGKKIQQFDSLTKQNFNSANLGELLSVNSPVFIKNYGPGNLSTSSFRGETPRKLPFCGMGLISRIICWDKPTSRCYPILFLMISVLNTEVLLLFGEVAQWAAVFI